MSLSESSSSRIDFHKGAVLWDLAGTYPNLPLMLIECVQNGIDADADRVSIFIDFSKRNRNILVMDNGSGVDRQRFELALASVGKGVKTKDKLGRFGRGLISPLDKCSSFVFVSSPLGQRKANKWTFRGEDIRKMHTELSIPFQSLDRIPTIPRKYAAYLTGEFAVSYQTSVALNGVNMDKMASLIDLDEFATNLTTKLGSAMRRSKVQVRIVLFDSDGRVIERDVSATEFTGEPLDIVAYEDVDAGRVEFRLFRAAKIGGNRRGMVGFMASGDSVTITVNEFRTQAMGGRNLGVINDALKALCSGYFEGTVICEKIDLDPERTKFRTGDALNALYLIIDQWYQDCGLELLNEEQEKSRDQRWQDIGLESLDAITDKLRTDAYKGLRDALLSAVDVGLLGRGHTPGETVGDDPSGPSVRTGQGGAGKPRRKDGTVIRDPHQPDKSRSGDVPIGAHGPRGNKRNVVANDSQGLMLRFDKIPGSTRIWDFERHTGTLAINVRHPIVRDLEETQGRQLAKNKRQSKQFLEWLVFKVLFLLSKFPQESEFDEHRFLIDDEIKYYVDLFVN